MVTHEDSIDTTNNNDIVFTETGSIFVDEHINHKPAFERTAGTRLMLAVLQDAVDIVLLYQTARTAYGQELFSETKEWFNSADTDWLYSFESICGELDVDPNYFRERLWRMVYRVRNGSE